MNRPSLLLPGRWTRLFGMTLLLAAMLLPHAGSVQAQANPQAMYNQFSQLYQQGRYADAERIGTLLLQMFQQHFGAGHANTGQIMNDLAAVQQAQGKFAAAEKLYRQALAVRENNFGRDNMLVAQTMNGLAQVYIAQNNATDAELLLKRTAAILGKAGAGQERNLATVLAYLGNAQKALGKYQDAAGSFERSAQLLETSGAQAGDLTSPLTGLAQVKEAVGNFGEAEILYKRILGLAEKAFGDTHPNVAIALNNLGNVFRPQGKFSDAIPVFERAITILESSPGAQQSVALAAALNNLGEVRLAQARYEEAEGHYRKALSLLESTSGADPRHVAACLNNLGRLYDVQGRYDEGEPLLGKSIALLEKVIGKTHPDLAPPLTNLALLKHHQGKADEALKLYERALAVLIKVHGENHVNVAVALNNVAGVYASQGRHVDAVSRLARAQKIFEAILGADHPNAAMAMGNRAKSLAAMGDQGQAKPLFEQAIVQGTRSLGAEHPVVARIHGNYGKMLAGAKQFGPAMDHYRKASAILEKRFEVASRGTPQPGDQQDRDIFLQMASAAFGLTTERPGKTLDLANEALIATQRAEQSSAAAALSQMAARFGGGDGKLADAVRRLQDLTTKWAALDKTLVSSFAKSGQDRDAAADGALRRALSKAEAELAQAKANIEKTFPAYFDLASPRPQPVGDLRKLLGADEALITYLVADDVSFVWAVTREGIEWRRIEAGRAALSASVAKLREGMDVAAVASGKADTVDIARLHALYKQVLEPVSKSIEGKAHLMVVPSGALTSLPFHMLVTAAPENPDDYAAAQWLVRKYAVTTLPSVASLRSLRVLATGEPANDAFIGFGDPVFGKAAPGDARSKTSELRSFTSYFRGTRADRDALAAALPPLPGTATELKAVAKSLGVPEGELRLGKRASETAVKRERLDNYRIVYFATHGLVAGETAKVSTLSEPALALTIPSELTEEDDGLLTASEVANLKLSADWVVLSACNTAAGDKPGAEALSGLARAFFYAGARAMLVSHWPVGDETSARLTSDAFARLTADPALGRAEALRQSMLAMIEDKSSPLNAYPASWAPFVVVGEGGRTARR